MHGAIWKLSALATVVGFGLLAVVVQQRGLGKNLGKASASADATVEGETANPNDADQSQAPDPESLGQGDRESSGPVPQTIPNSKAPDDPNVELTEIEEEADSRGTGKTSSTASRGGRPKPAGLVDDGDDPSTPPVSAKPMGSRNGLAAQPQNAFEEDGPDPSAVSPKSPALVQTGGPAVQTRAEPQAKSVDEEENDPLNRRRVRPARSPGTSSSGLDDGSQPEVVGQAPNTRQQSPDEFENQPEELAVPPAPRTGTRTGVGSRTQPNRNPRQKFIDEGTNEVDAPVSSQTNPSRPESNLGLGAAGAVPGGRLNSALQDPDEDAIPHNSQPGNGGTRVENSATENGSSDAGFTDQQNKSAARKNSLPPIEPDPESNAGQNDFNSNQNEQTATPPVTPRPRPRIDDGDDATLAPSSPSEKLLPATGGDAPQPIQKRAPQKLEVQEFPPQGSVGNTAPRNRSRRPNSLSEDEEGNSEQPPAMFPMGKQRPRIDSADDVSTSSEAGNSAAGNNSGIGQGGLDDANATVSPTTSQPDGSPGSSNSSPTNRPRIDEDQPGAAASGDSATNVIAPRTPVFPAAGAGVVRGRARVTIEKLAPPTAILGQPLIYSIVIRNSGNAAAKQVVVEDDVPEGVTMQGSIPQAEMTGRKLKWFIGNLEVGQEQKISVKVVPTAEGPVGSAATVNFVHDTRSIANGGEDAADGRVSLELQYPQQVSIGSAFEVRFRLVNRTNQTLTKLTILNQLPPSLRHESRKQDLEYKVDTLGPGEILEVPLSVTASQAGPTSSRTVVMSQDERILTSKEFRVNVYAGSP